MNTKRIAALVMGLALLGTGVVTGQSGMTAHADGLAYEVEFEEPHVVLTIEGEDLRG